MTMESSEVQQAIPDQAAITKAQLVLTALRSAALRPPFRFDEESPDQLWALALGAFSVDVLTGAAGQWVLTNEEFPTLSEFLTLVRYHDKMARADVEDAANSDVCPECADVHWLRVQDDPQMVFDRKLNKEIPVEMHHMAPCRLCLPERYELYERGHFDAEHVDAGGCKYCAYYMKPWHPQKNSHNKHPLPH